LPQDGTSKWKLRIFDAVTLEELCQNDSLTSLSYVITLNGTEIGSHPNSVYGATQTITAGPPSYPFFGSVFTFMAEINKYTKVGRKPLIPRIFGDMIGTLRRLQHTRLEVGSLVV
jgi:hypothetical protein